MGAALPGKGRPQGQGARLYPEVGLKEARSRAAADRTLLANGLDPIEERRAARKTSKPVPSSATSRISSSPTPTASRPMPKCATSGSAASARSIPAPSWPGRCIDHTVDVATVLRPVWRTKPEVARKLYPAITRVFERARILLRDEHGISMAEIPRGGRTSRRWGLRRRCSSAKTDTRRCRTR